jgi:hypothetical protein
MAIDSTARSSPVSFGRVVVPLPGTHTVIAPGSTDARRLRHRQRDGLANERYTGGGGYAVYAPGHSKSLTR